MYRLSLITSVLLQVSIILGNCVFKWQDEGIISEHDPNLKHLSSPAATDVGRKSRDILKLSQLSSQLLKTLFFPRLFYEEVKKIFEIPVTFVSNFYLFGLIKSYSCSNRPCGSNELF